jgi:hypothetical protein
MCVPAMGEIHRFEKEWVSENHPRTLLCTQAVSDIFVELMAVRPFRVSSAVFGKRAWTGTIVDSDQENSSELVLAAVVLAIQCFSFTQNVFRVTLYDTLLQHLSYHCPRVLADDALTPLS